jgi:hypothetical protein
MQTLGKYQLGELLGQGGMGAVYRSFHPILNRPVALKVMLGPVAADPQAHQRFLREAQVVAALSHPNIVNIFDVDVQDGRPYIVMDYVEGGSLAARLRAGPLALDEALRLAIPLAEALAYAHGQGVIHRDIKPANVLLRPDGSPVLADFGLARPLQADSAAQLTATGAVMGTLAYMAPEQFSGRPTDARADIYAFGVLLYELLTGRLPFEGDSAQIMYGHLQQPPPTPSLINPGLPAAAEQLLLRMLAKDPGWRPQSAAEVAAALRDLQSGAAATGPTIVMPRPAGTFSIASAGRPPWLLVAGLGAGGLLAIGLLIAAALTLASAPGPVVQRPTPLIAISPIAARPTTVERDPPASPIVPASPVPPSGAALELIDQAQLAGAAKVGPEPFTVGGVTYRQDADTVWFFGEVRNDAAEARESVQVRVILRDASGAELLSKSSSAELGYLNPGEVAPFSVLFTKDDAPPKFASYDIEVRSSKADFQLGYTYRDLAISATGPARPDSLNFVKVSGRVQNKGARAAKFVQIFAVFYDAKGRVVGLTSTFAERDNDAPLAAGADARFELSAVIFSATPAKYRLIVEGANAT